MAVQRSYDGQMLDITAPTVVEVEVSGDGKVVWVNVDGICAFRACRIGNLALTDKRVEKCAIHDVVETQSDESYQCMECRHIYPNKDAILKQARETWPGVSVKDADDVACCPLCLHDW